jgi:sugar lactone lactonase YvrE
MVTGLTRFGSQRWGALTGRRALAVTAAAIAAVGLSSAPASAHGRATPSGPDLRVVASGLDNPRGITTGPDGALYVAEAGRGSDDPAHANCIVTTDPESGEQVTNCLGFTSALTKISNGHVRRVVTGLPSVADASGMAAGGITSVAIKDGRYAAVIGCGCDPRDKGANTPSRAVKYAGHILWLDPRHNRFHIGTDVSAYEVNNPDAADPGSSFDTNPYALTFGRHGNLVVADAGGNDVLQVSPYGRVSTLAVLHATLIDAPPFLGLPPGTKIPLQAVPNSITRGPDGAYYVGQLTGFPFPVGAASVWRIVPGHAPTRVASGFTNIIDVTFDHRGRLVVLEIATNGLLDENSPGALWVVDRWGHKTLAAKDGLVAPGGVAIGRDNRAYITNFSIFPHQGQVVSVRLPR